MCPQVRTDPTRPTAAEAAPQAVVLDQFSLYVDGRCFLHRVDLTVAEGETLVVAGHLVTELAVRNGALLIPIDSEMTPLWQTFQNIPKKDVKRVVLPASGGPFFDHSPAQMARVTPAEALNHPTWNMGPKITIDSATLMNKGFEVIEARWFLGLPVSRVDVIIHRQSVVHCLIEYVDRGVTAHLSTPDMRLPIHQALVHPEKLLTRGAPLDLAAVGTLSFFEPDFERFPCLGLAYEVMKTGGTAPAVLNAANEIAVYAFLDNRIGFLDIARVTHQALAAHNAGSGTDLEALFEADRWGREKAEFIVKAMEK